MSASSPGGDGCGAQPHEDTDLTPEEVAAVVAAVDAAWPSADADEAPVAQKSPTWRFSGRWWLPGHGVAAERRRP